MPPSQAIFFKDIYILLYVYGCFTFTDRCVPLCPRRSEDGIISPCGCSKPNLGPLQEQQMLLITETSLKTHDYDFGVWKSPSYFKMSSLICWPINRTKISKPGYQYIWNLSYTLNKYTESYLLRVWDQSVRRNMQAWGWHRNRIIIVARKQNPKEPLEKNV